MIALDTNILARYYVVDEADPESARQHAQVVKALSGKERFYVPKTVLLELEWVYADSTIRRASTSCVFSTT